MKNKQIRRIIVLIMCLLLIFNVVTSASAAGIGTIFFGSIAAAAVVASAYQCLGVLKGMDDTDFVNLVNSGISLLESTTDLVSEGYIRMLGVKYGDTDQFLSYAQDTMIQALAEFVSSSSTINDVPAVSYVPVGSYSSPVYSDQTNTTWRIVYESSAPVITFCFKNSGYTSNQYEVWAISTSDFNYKMLYNNDWEFSDGTSSYNSSYGCYAYMITRQQLITGLPLFSGNLEHRNNIIPLIINGTINYLPNIDISLGGYAAPYIDGAPVGFGSLAVYMPWASRGVSVPLPGSATDEDWVPVTIGGIALDDTVVGQTQAEAQAGTVVDGITWEEVGAGSIPDTEVGTATLANILSAVLSIPQAIVGSISQALSDFFGLSGTADSYAISLTDFFPFCIPFDIYDFLSVLSAAPEAPVFHWEIPVPQLGRTFDIDIDLSPWDPVAAVFRTFELLAFIVGLGMVTREKFLRS